MPTLEAELLMSAILAASLLLVPLASRLIGSVGEEISRRVDDGLSI